jgi:hypothetical protein
MTPEEKTSLIIDDASVKDIEVSESEDGDDAYAGADERPAVNPVMKEEDPKPKS